MSIRIAINGFGRMGKLGFRAGWGRPEYEIVHINEIRGDAACHAHLNVINLRPNSLFCRKISSIHHHLKESEMNSVPAVPTTDQAVLPKII